MFFSELFKCIYCFNSFSLFLLPIIKLFQMRKIFDINYALYQIKSQIFIKLFMFG